LSAALHENQVQLQKEQENSKLLEMLVASKEQSEKLLLDNIKSLEGTVEQLKETLASNLRDNSRRELELRKQLDNLTQQVEIKEVSLNEREKILEQMEMEEEQKISEFRNQMEFWKLEASKRAAEIDRLKQILQNSYHFAEREAGAKRELEAQVDHLSSKLQEACKIKEYHELEVQKLNSSLHLQSNLLEAQRPRLEAGDAEKLQDELREDRTKLGNLELELQFERKKFCDLLEQLQVRQRVDQREKDFELAALLSAVRAQLSPESEPLKLEFEDIKSLLIMEREARVLAEGRIEEYFVELQKLSAQNSELKKNNRLIPSFSIKIPKIEWINQNEILQRARSQSLIKF